MIPDRGLGIVRRWGGFALGVVFAVAGIIKVLAPATFAGDIAGFGVAPLWAVAPLAILLPWWELVGVLGLLFPGFRRAAALLLAVLLLAFLGAMVIVLIRGETVRCGCFGPWPITVGWPHLLFNAFLLLVALTICGKGQRTVSPPGPSESSP
jgi:uncharacterized membrane protein YphA (DoxX/SURF4 family)